MTEWIKGMGRLVNDPLRVVTGFSSCFVEARPIRPDDERARSGSQFLPPDGGRWLCHVYSIDAPIGNPLGWQLNLFTPTGQPGRPPGLLIPI